MFLMGKLLVVHSFNCLFLYLSFFIIPKALQKRRLGSMQLPGDKLPYPQGHNAVQWLIWDSPGKNGQHLETESRHLSSQKLTLLWQDLEGGSCRFHFQVKSHHALPCCLVMGAREPAHRQLGSEHLGTLTAR